MKWRNSIFQPIFFAPEPGGAPSPQGQGNGGGAGGSPPDPAGGAGGGAPPPPAPDGGWQAPAYIPEGLRGKDMAETFDRLGADWQRQRQTISGLPQPGKAAADYLYAPSDKVAPLVGDLAKDPMFGLAQEAALKAGVPVPVFQTFVGGLYEAMADKGLLAKPYSVEQELSAFLGDGARGKTLEQMQTEFLPVYKELDAFVKAAAAQGKMSPGESNALSMLLDTADGVRALQKLAAVSKQAGISPGGGGQAQGMTAEKLREMQRDPRADRDSAAFDPAYLKQVADAYRAFYG